MKVAVRTPRTKGEYEVKLCTCVLYGRVLLERVLKTQGVGIWTAFTGGLPSFQNSFALCSKNTEINSNFREMHALLSSVQKTGRHLVS